MHKSPISLRGCRLPASHSLQMDYRQSNIDAAMTSSATTSPDIVVLATLYVLVEAAHFILRTYTFKSKFDMDRGEVDRSTAMAKWRSELAAQGAKGGSAVDDWVDGWFEPINAGGGHTDVRRGNVEIYLSGELSISSGLPLEADEQNACLVLS